MPAFVMDAGAPRPGRIIALVPNWESADEPGRLFRNPSRSSRLTVAPWGALAAVPIRK
jgi:hypothetical protein